MSKTKRQLAAVMFTDIQGYTALMQENEEHAHQIRKRHREVFDSATEEYNGDVLQYYGDGTLSKFDSVVEAVDCAIHLQTQYQQDIVVPVRIGIHLGDIIIEDGEVIGDAVNIASRVESMAVPGSVLVSDRVHQDLHNHGHIKTQSLGRFRLKNVKSPVEIFAITNKGLVVPRAEDMKGKGEPETGTDTPNNLPHPTTQFFGREKELREAKLQLDNQRLVTLLGAGGCGKTRLSIECAAKCMDKFPEGIWFVALAAVTNPDLVAASIAETLHINPERDTSIVDTVAKSISGKKLLLVVDNCEHVIDECAPLLHSIVTKTTEPRILVTSREALNIPGESILKIAPLEVPETPANMDEIESFHSIQLFRDRVHLNNPNFKLDQANATIISSICQKVDGIPLAIEMAASRVKVMDPQTILDRLSDQFRLLSTGTRNAPQHQLTLKATIDWSYDLLSDEEQLLFCRLSVFAGSFDLADAEKVCGYDPLTEWQVLDLLTQLVDKSLVTTVEVEGTTRYRLLELMKQYGMEMLSGERELTELHESFVDFYLHTVEVNYMSRMENSLHWSQWFVMELANLQEVFNLLKLDPFRRLKLASLLTESFFASANLSVGRELLTTALEGASEESQERALTLCGLGFMEVMIDPEMGYRRMKEGIEIIERLGDEQAKLTAYHSFAMLKSFFKEYDEANEILEKGLRIAQKHGDRWMAARYTSQFGWVALAENKLDEVEEDIEKNLQEAKLLGDHYHITDVLHLQAYVRFRKGNYIGSEESYIKAAQSSMQGGEGMELGVLLHGIALSVSGQGRHEKGLRLYGASEAKLTILGAEIPSVESVAIDLEKTIDKSRKILGPDVADRLDQEGRNMGFQKALQYAFEATKD